MKDLKLEKDSYKKQELLLKKLCSVKIEPKKNLRKNEKLPRGRDKTPNFSRSTRGNLLNCDKKNIRSKTPNLVLNRKRREHNEKGKEKNENLKRAKTPLKIEKRNQNSKIPSYMAETSSNMNKNKKFKDKSLNLKRFKTPEETKKYRNAKKKEVTKINKDNNNDNNLKIIDLSIKDMKAYIESNEDNKPKIEEKKKEENLINFNLLIDNNKIINILSSFLDEQSQYNLFSCNKQLMKYIYEKLLTSIDELKKENEISTSKTIQDQINSLRLKFKNDELNADPPKFVLSKATTKAIEMLNTDIYNKIFRTKESNLPQDEILLIYRIFFQLLKVNNIYNIKDDKLFWMEVCEYILNNNNNKTGEFFKESVNNFDFSIKNIYQLKKMVNGKQNKINPNLISKICSTTSLLIFLIKDTLEYLGVFHNSKKNIPCLLLKYLEYIGEIENKIENYINYIKKIKN